MFAKKLKKFITISAKVNRHGRNFPKPIAFLKFLKARQQWRVPVFSSVRRTNAIPHRTSHQLVAARAAPARLPPPPTRPHHHDQAFLECPCLQFGYAWVHLLSIGPCSVEDSRNLIKICQWLLEIDICADRDVDLHVLGDLSFDMSSIKGGLTQIISASELNIASEETAAEKLRLFMGDFIDSTM